MKNFDKVKEGDIVCHITTGNSFQVSATMEHDDVKILILTRTISAMNPSEWELVAIATAVQNG